MERENNITIRGLPRGKRNGFCDPAWVDDDPNRHGCGEVIDILSTCTKCKIGECHMFRPVYDESGNIIQRVFKKHKPAY